jgi:hypothetical protein
MQKLYHAIISNGVKDNTYKFALMKFLLDYSKENIQSNEIQISYEDIANKFLEYYWFQECKYKLKQDFKVKRMPMVIRIIRKYCGEEYIPESYDKYFKSKQYLKEIMIKEIENKCLQDVIPRLQPKGYNTIYKHFHTLNDEGKKYKLPHKDKRYIIFTTKAQVYFKDNYNELSKILIYEWAKFLEKTNFTPRLISKIENLGLNNRSSLTKYKNILLKQMEAKCFYCNCDICANDIHIDHFIPWSYAYEDAIWNLVISCKKCNLKKNDYLAPKECVQKIEDRNNKYCLNEYNKDIMEYYVNCNKSGFLALDKNLICS